MLRNCSLLSAALDCANASPHCATMRSMTLMRFWSIARSALALVRKPGLFWASETNVRSDRKPAAATMRRFEQRTREYWCSWILPLCEQYFGLRGVGQSSAVDLFSDYVDQSNLVGGTPKSRTA